MTLRTVSVAVASLVLSGHAYAQATIKTDGQWRAAIGAGMSLASGNTDSRLLNITGDVVKATTANRWNLYGQQVYGRVGGATTADLFNLGARYLQDINPQWFWFGQGDLHRNKLANLSMRGSMAGGAGYHVIKSDPLVFDVFAGLGFASDRYINSTVIGGESRSSYHRMELMLGEESIHKLTSNTNFKQRLVLYPNLTDRGEFRANFDAGLSVAMSSTLSLTATWGLRHNSDPGTGIKKTDTLLFTGITYKYE